MEQLCGAALDGQRAIDDFYILKLGIKAQIFDAVFVITLSNLEDKKPLILYQRLFTYSFKIHACSDFTPPTADP